MATFVLVHGAWHGGWCYGRVAKLLRAAGHEVYTPTHTGVGERAHLADYHITLATHVRDVTNVIEYENLSDVIICGNSYGGMVITGVAASLGERIKSLVYLDAFVPEDGQSLFDLIGPDMVNQFLNLGRTMNGRLPPITAAAWQIGIGCFPVAMMGLAFETTHLDKVTTTGWVLVFYGTVIQFCVAYVSWFAALARLPASVAAIGTMAVPVIGVVASAIALHEPLGPGQIAALVLTLAAVVLATRS